MVLRLLCLLGLQSTKETVRLMREKHPIAEYSFFKASSDAQQLSFNAEQVRKADKFLREGSVPGPKGFGAEHLNAAIKLYTLDRQGLLRRHRCSWSTSWRTMGGSVPLILWHLFCVVSDSMQGIRRIGA